MDEDQGKASALAERIQVARVWRSNGNKSNWPKGYASIEDRLPSHGPYSAARKAKHIPDEDFLAVVAALSATPHSWATRWDVAAVLGASQAVVLAKARKLIGRQLIDGCGCGCRGDFTVAKR